MSEDFVQWAQEMLPPHAEAGVLTVLCDVCGRTQTVDLVGHGMDIYAGLTELRKWGWSIVTGFATCRGCSS